MLAAPWRLSFRELLHDDDALGNDDVVVACGHHINTLSEFVGVDLNDRSAVAINVDVEVLNSQAIGVSQHDVGFTFEAGEFNIDIVVSRVRINLVHNSPVRRKME